MLIKSSIALTLAMALTAGSVPVIVKAAPQADGNGVIGGKADDEAKKPYTDYKVQLRDVATSQIVSTVALDPQARFTFSNVPMTKRFLVELYNTPKNKIVCTEGPYGLSSTLMKKTDVNVNCGGNPAAWWLLSAGGAAAAIALGVRSPNAG
jgi:hypothetical protein